MNRYTATLVLLVIATGAHLMIAGAQAQQADQTAPPTAIDVPARIMGFEQVGEDMQAGEYITNLLETNTILMRRYRAPSGWPLQLTIVYSENTRRSIHFPEVCFTGQGWETHGKASVPVGLQFVAQGITVQRGDAQEAVLYWFQTGDDCTGNYFINSLYYARDTLMLQEPATMLVRLSTPIGRLNTEQAYGLLNEFAAALAPILVERYG